jgi:hypothetical protein
MALQPLGLTSKIVAYNNEVDLSDKTSAPKTQGATVNELMQFAGGVAGSDTVFIKPVGTAEENGVALLAGLEAAVGKVTTETGPPVAYRLESLSYFGYDNLYEGRTDSRQDLPFSYEEAWRTTWNDSSSDSYEVDIVFKGNRGGGRFEFNATRVDGGTIDYSGRPDFPGQPSVITIPSTLIVAPGDYSIASDFILNNFVNITSLTGNADVNISTSNVKIQSGANSSSIPITITGLNLASTLYIESNLPALTFKNCVALGSGSFGIENSGTGSIAGTFIDCIGGYGSFGSGAGVTAAGVFIRCKSTGSGFAKAGSTSGYFENCGGAIYSSDFGGRQIANNMFGNEGDTVNGFFYYCSARNASFASNNTGATYAQFHYCTAANQSFAYRNTNNQGLYYNCVSTGSQAFGSNTLGDTAPNARYYNCTATTMARSSTLGSQFYNCHAHDNWYQYSATDGGLAYNCSFGRYGGQLAPTGTGKYRNCLSDGYTIINQG